VLKTPQGRVQQSGDEMRGNAKDIIAAVDSGKHCDAISKPTVLLQFVAVDGRQLRLVGKIKDADLRVEVENGRDFGVVQIEIYKQRSRPRSQYRSEPDGDACRSVGAG
jgi:hypothetical protein